jgi:lysine 6-dehydrogenase
MKKSYAILGSGMQGTCAAYDLARFGNPERILLGDLSIERAKQSADRVNRLVGVDLCVPCSVNAMNANDLGAFLAPADVLLSCVPYFMHPEIAKVAIQSGTHMCDLGGNTEITLQTLSMDDAARSAGVVLVPDCGLAPGLVNSLGLYLMEQMDQPVTIKLYCGVLPQNPIPPLNYKVTFNVEGLVAEYDYRAVVIRDGEIVEVDTLGELERVENTELGTLEAFTTSGGTSTAPYTFKGRVENYEYKTLRFPGHCELMRLFRDFGLWREDEVDVRGVNVRPKDVFCRVFGEALGQIKDSDQCVIRAVGMGIHHGEPVTHTVDIFDREDPETGFTSMERLTGFSLSILAQHVAAGRVDPGACRYENAMRGGEFVDELRRRGVTVRTG